MVEIALPRYSDDPNEYRKAWTKRKRRRDPEFARQQSEAARAWQKANPVRNAWAQYRRAAKRRGLAWALSREVFERLVMADCHYCGLPAPLPAINGVDRIDNTVGYTHGNVVTACVHCNYAKRDLRVEEFLAWARRLVTFQEGSHGRVPEI